MFSYTDTSGTHTYVLCNTTFYISQHPPIHPTIRHSKVVVVFNGVHIITVMNINKLVICRNRHSVHIWNSFYCLTFHSALHIVLVLHWLNYDLSRPCACSYCCLIACIICFGFKRLSGFSFSCLVALFNHISLRCFGELHFLLDVLCLCRIHLMKMAPVASDCVSIWCLNQVAFWLFAVFHNSPWVPCSPLLVQHSYTLSMEQWR